MGNDPYHIAFNMEQVSALLKSLNDQLSRVLFIKTRKNRNRKNKNKQTRSSSLTVPDEKLLNSLKSRFNYASTSCSARILATNPEAQGAAAILAPSKDSYLRNSCSTRSKFVVVELCEEVKIDAIVLANFELFSSTFKRFKIYGAADKLLTEPTTTSAQKILWKLLLEGEMQEGRAFLHSEQAFPVASNQVFYKYLRVEFDDEHYGHERLCPVSCLKVFGKTMLDEFNEELHQSKIVDDHLPVFASEVSSPELMELINEMTQISSQITQLQMENTRLYRNSSTVGIDHQTCLKEEQQLIDLKERYSDLENRSFLLQAQSKSSHGNVFKNLHDRLNKLENSLKQHPLNLILFRTPRTEDDNNDAGGFPKLISDIPIPELTSLSDEMNSLKTDFKRIQSDLSIQQHKLTFLIVFNITLLTLFLAGTIRKWLLGGSSKNQSAAASEFRRCPLTELKSPSTSPNASLAASSSVANLADREEHKRTMTTTPGVVLSEDEVLMYDEE